MSLDGDGEGDCSLWLEGTDSVGAQKGGVERKARPRGFPVLLRSATRLTLANTRFTPKSLFPSCFPRCHPLSPPRTPHITPPTPVGPGTPPAAPNQVSHRRFRLWSAPNPASAPRCSPLLVAPPQYTLNPCSAVGRDPRCPPVPGFPAPACVASAPRAFRISVASIPHAPKQTGQSFGPSALSPTLGQLR
ncbi:hypothetical protein PGT21_031658 [Puccinia graminis f. sp. tritici]|uniref:Uncharacterized protein n=1 Tax=Puccinia graminis f. sp. tritici TaxID=56615 RepID=A0A5B0MGI2_PUCGR|nr:hypothetical protein PGT21_031658 [Puccinia graminis f. sp. tritici]